MVKNLKSEIDEDNFFNFDCNENKANIGDWVLVEFEGKNKNYFISVK